MTVASVVTIAISITTGVTVHIAIIIVYSKKYIEGVLQIFLSYVTVSNAVVILVRTVVLIYKT
jgi:hypothetical protein